MSEVLASDAVLVDGRFAPGWLAIDDGVVVEQGEGDAPAGAQHLGTDPLVPGFVDLQLNGLDDLDLSRVSGAEWDRVGTRLIATGVTSYLPTICSGPRAQYADALDRIASARQREVGARIEGVHLEGPFLGGAPGAHPPEVLGPVDHAWLGALLDRWPGLVRMVTLAPEADPDLSATRALTARDVRVALGHSTCTFEAAVDAAAAGARLVTHVGNGMRPLHQRDPGLLGAALLDARLVPTVIADGVHLHDGFLALVLARRPDAILVTDAVATGVEYFGAEVVARDGAARLPDGTLAGSVLTLDAAVRHCVRVGVHPAAAVAMASSNPARAIGLDTWGGRGVGGRADVVQLDADTLRPRRAWVAGRRS